MTYLASVEIEDAEPLLQSPAKPSFEPPSFTQLEWSVIRLSRSDKLWSTIPTSLQRLLNFLLARKANRLANDRLEELRRMAVLSRHFGFSVRAEKVGAFFEAGFSVEQYELLVRSVLPSATPPIVGMKALT